MTSTQLIWGWGVYTAGALACLLAMWLITGNINIRIRRLLRAGVAALLLTPWWHSADVNLLMPAFWIMIYDGLSSGFPAMARSGLPLVVATSLCSLLAVMLPASPESGEKKTAPAPDQNNRHHRRERQEPTV